MAYRFRLRWRFERGRSLKELAAPTQAELGADFPDCELKVVGEETRLGGQSLALLSGLFSSADSAREAGEKLQSALVLTSLYDGYGVALAARMPTGFITAYGKEFLNNGRFDTVLDDSYGLTVFEASGRTGFAGVGEITASIAQPTTLFLERLRASLAIAPATESRLLIAYDLLANSRFESSSRARFLLLMMAVESLVKREMRSQEEIAVVESLISLVDNTVNLPAGARDALKAGVGQLRWRSSAGSCREYLLRAESAGVLSQAGAAERFGRYYVTRNKMVHDGITPDAVRLADDSGQLETMVRELLTALMERRWA